MNRTIIFLIPLFFYASIISSATHPNNSTNQLKELESDQQKYELLQKRISPYLQQWRPIIVERNKYSITPLGVIGRLLLGATMVGPALTANYLNQYITTEKYKDPINKITLAIAAASTVPTVYNLLKTTTGSFYDALTYPDIEAIKTQNAKVFPTIKIFNDDINDMEQKLFSLDDYAKSSKAYYDIIDLFKTPRTYFDTLSLKNTQKENLKKFFETHKDYNKEKLRFLLERKKTELIIDIEQPDQNLSGFSSWGSEFGNNPSLAIVSGIIMLPWMVLGAIISSNNKTNLQLDQNKAIALIDIILTALALLR